MKYIISDFQSMKKIITKHNVISENLSATNFPSKDGCDDQVFRKALPIHPGFTWHKINKSILYCCIPDL